VEFTARHRIRENMKGNMRVSAPITLEPGPCSSSYPVSTSDRASHTPPPEATCKPLEAILAGLETNTRTVKRVASGRIKTEATVEALLGNLDHNHKCTLVHLARGGQVCLGYTGEGGRLHANRDEGGTSP
jgi:hypothetical protein